MPTWLDQKRRGVIITIDGPAGTGKSTVARLLARHLGLEFLDTGAMYRAAALLAIEQGIAPPDGPALARAVGRADLHFDFAEDPPRMKVGDRDVSVRIRDLNVGEIVSVVASQEPLRRVLVEMQRAIARDHPRLVSEGRDQGSVVFPEAAVRFYLDADVTERARRRAGQLEAAGIEVDHDCVVREIARRDEMDCARADGPLLRPPGAIEIDSSRRSAEEVGEELARIVRERLGKAGLGR